MDTRIKERKRHRIVERVGEYNVGKAIGRGNFAVVRLAKHSIANCKVAIKIVDKNRLDEENLLKIEREIHILKSLDHPHIIKLYEIIKTDQYIYLVTEYAGHGEVFEMLMEKGRIGETEARRLFQQTTAAVAYCHSHGIVHRDLKAENLLLDKHNDVKLIDFGFSNFQSPRTLLSTWCGSPPYAAPELLLGKEYDGTKADAWSLGVVLYILVTGGFPFPGDSIDKLKRAVLAGQLKIPYWVSVACSDLIRKMLTFHPSKRLSVENVMQHRWFVMEQSAKMQQLLRESTSSGLHPDVPSSPRLNPTVMLFMQQHTKWSEEQIVDEVVKRNYESPVFATYELLCDKVRDAVDEAAGATSSQPRRGSRGSILSGKANVEVEASAPTISAHHLAKLSLSTSVDQDSDKSDFSEGEDSSSPRCSWTQRHAFQLGPAVGVEQPSTSFNRAEVRRHTLCAADRFLPLETLLLAQQIPPGSPLAAAAAAHAAAAAALAAHSATNPFANTAMPTNLLALSQFQPYAYNRILPLPSLERRASAGEAIFGVSGYEQMFGTQPAIDGMLPVNRCPPSSSTPAQGTPIAPVLNIEEEGEKYLSQFGATKRNTVHCVGSEGIGTSSSSTVSRIARSPYSKQNGGERRSSWTSSNQHSLINPQQQAQLERLYKQTVGGGSDQLIGIQQLQREFQQLKASTQPSPRASRTPPLLLDSSCSLKGAPRISITDENNRCLTQPSSSNTFDSISMFEKQADPIAFRQRPATAIGFASTSGTSSPKQRFSPCETAAKSVMSPLEIHQVIRQLRSALDNLHITYEESTPFIDDAPVKAHRIYVDNGDTGRVEIGVSTVPLSISHIRSKVEFVCSGIDIMGCGHLCSELISKLNSPV